MRVLLAVTVPISAALLQGAVAPLVAVAGAAPSFPMLVAACWSIAVGAREALWWGFVGGLALDLLSGGPLGAYTVAALPGVLVVGLGERSAAKPVPVVNAALAVALGVLLTQALYLGILAVLGRSLGTGATVVAQTVGVGIYTGALALVAYPVARSGRRLGDEGSPF